MRRRDLITLLGGAAAWPVVARAQDKPLPVIGWLSASADDYKNLTVPFFRVLKETGYVEGQNVAVEYRWAENDYDRLPLLAAGLVRRGVAVIGAATVSQRWRRRQRPRPYPSSLAPVATQSHWVLSPASTGPAGTSPVSPF